MDAILDGKSPAPAFKTGRASLWPRERVQQLATVLLVDPDTVIAFRVEQRASEILGGMGQSGLAVLASDPPINHPPTDLVFPLLDVLQVALDLRIRPC